MLPSNRCLMFRKVFWLDYGLVVSCALSVLVESKCSKRMPFKVRDRRRRYGGQHCGGQQLDVLRLRCGEHALGEQERRRFLLDEQQSDERERRRFRRGGQQHGGGQQGEQERRRFRFDGHGQQQGGQQHGDFLRRRRLNGGQHG